MFLMGDFAFIFDQDKGHSDIKVVAGDFLLCDKEVTEVVDPEETGSIPNRITISGTGTAVDMLVNYAYELEGKPSYIESGVVSVSWKVVFPQSNWRITNIDTTEVWSTTEDSEIPPKDGWSVGSLGSPAPTINYVTQSSTEFTYQYSSLQVAVEMSIFTDRRATTAEIQQFQSGIQERQTRRGFWGNTFKDYTQGSGLWLLEREKKTNETLSRAKVYCNDSLQWLVDGGVVESVETETSFDGDALIITVSITKPDGQPAGFKYQFTWDSLEAIK